MIVELITVVCPETVNVTTTAVVLEAEDEATAELLELTGATDTVVVLTICCAFEQLGKPFVMGVSI